MWLSLASVVASSVMIVFSGIAIHAWNWVSWEWFDGECADTRGGVRGIDSSVGFFVGQSRSSGR